MQKLVLEICMVLHVVPFLGYIHWYSKLVVHCLTMCSISTFMLVWCTYSLARSHICATSM